MKRHTLENVAAVIIGTFFIFELPWVLWALFGK